MPKPGKNKLFQHLYKSLRQAHICKRIGFRAPQRAFCLTNALIPDLFFATFCHYFR